MFCVVLHINVYVRDSYVLDIGLNGVLDVYEGAHVIAYMQASEIPIGLTPKECD
jgi:hypothetical protein